MGEWRQRGGLTPKLGIFFFSVFVFKHSLDMHGMGEHAVGVHGVGVHGMGAHGMGGHDVGVHCSHLPLFKVVLSKSAISYFQQEEGIVAAGGCGSARR